MINNLFTLAQLHPALARIALLHYDIGHNANIRNQIRQANKSVIKTADKTIHYLGHKIHKDDGPAIECANGDKMWYKNGDLHNEEGPAIEKSNGDKEWYIKGQLHRENGPATVWPNGRKAWYIEGQLHREDGPAIEDENGYLWYNRGVQHRPENDEPALYIREVEIKMWYHEGLKHRTKGPAVIIGYRLFEEWWINGIKVDSSVIALFQSAIQ